MYSLSIAREELQIRIENSTVKPVRSLPVFSLYRIGQPFLGIREEVHFCTDHSDFIYVVRNNCRVMKTKLRQPVTLFYQPIIYPLACLGSCVCSSQLSNDEKLQ